LSYEMDPFWWTDPEKLRRISGRNLSILYSLFGSPSAIVVLIKLFIEFRRIFVSYWPHDDELETKWLFGKYQRNCCGFHDKMKRQWHSVG
jgi:hypothetical protein